MMSDLEEMGFEILTQEIDICFSPDDEEESGKGYCLVHTQSQRISDLYPTRAECLLSLPAWKKRWEAS